MTIDIQGVITDLEGAVLDAKTGFAEQATLISYLSVNNDDLSAANIALQAQLDTARASIASKDAEIAALKAKLEASQPKPPPAPVVKDVRYYGAKGDGVTDDTAAFQVAANSGSLIVPDGDYLIDAVKSVNINLDKTVVRMTAGAKLRAKANSQSRYYLLDVNASDCDIDCGGAQFYGDRLKHTFTAGSWHEHGYGIFLGGARNKLRNFRVYECTGDGVGVTGPDHEVSGAECKRNRRNGLSAFRSANLWIHDSEFSETGFLTDSTGLQGPFAGIDVEPDNGNANVKIERVKCYKNQKSGIVMWVRDEVASLLNVTISDCDIQGSPNAIWGKDEAVRAPTINCTVMRNKLSFGSGAAVKADQGSRFVVGDASAANANTIDSATGTKATAQNYGIQQPNGGVATKGVNTFV